VPSLDLARPRELGELISVALRLYSRNFSLFFTPAVVVVAPYVLIVDGIWGRQLADGADAHGPRGAASLSIALSLLVAQPLITAINVRIVQAMGEGRVPALGEAVRAALRVFLPVVVVVALFSLGVGLGFLLLIVPGVYLLVRWYFGPQAVVADGLRGAAALERSAEIVQGQWWSTAGRLIAISLVGLVVGLIVGGILGAIGEAVGSPALYVAGQILSQAAATSFAALAGTLLFFDRRARRLTTT
jgi:hypothetical protein